MVEQYKYDVDADASWLRRLLFYFWCVLIELGLEYLKFVSWDERRPDGSYVWKELQGVFAERWQAAQEAGKYKHARITRLITNEALPANSVLVSAIHPDATTRAYDRINDRTVSFPKSEVERLQRKIEATDSTVAHFKAQSV